MMLIQVALAVTSALLCVNAVENRNINVCDSANPKLLGVYLPGAEMDGAATFSNQNDLSFYRNKGFWYLGDLSSWPPTTLFRCVLDCPEGELIPPSSETGLWTPNRKFANEPAPIINHGKCAVFDEL